MDRVDRTILQELEEDGRLSFSDLGERVGLSKSPCWKRVQTLESEGVIRGYKAVLDPGKLGLDASAFVRITISFDQHEAFERAVTKHPRVMAAHAIVGEADYLLQVLTTTMGTLDDFLRQDLWRLPGVQRFSTTIAIRTIKSDGSLLRNINEG
jgi:Lrp/AsnC family leucine-responsive transcriptional regulator